MARYERFDDDIRAPKFTIVTRTPDEKIDLFVSSQPSLSNENETTQRHALITLNIISIFVSIVCGLITFFLAIEERSISALGFAVDTILDVLSFLIIIWRFQSSNEQTKREIYVLRILAILFFTSGLGVCMTSIFDLRNRIHPIPNHYLAIAVTLETLIFFCLALGKFIAAKKLNIISVYSDALNTFISGLTALSVVISIKIYNSNENIWYIDPTIGMFISIIIMLYGIWMMFQSYKNI